MIFKLEEPFKSRWRKAYIRESKDGRKRIDLFNSNEDRTTISYSRYLMSLKEGRFLNANEEVDHIDGNNSNDVIGNLQLLTLEDHRNKSAKEKRGRKHFKVRCPNCQKEFIRASNLVKRKYKLTFCTLSCNAKFWHKNKEETEEFINFVAEQQLIEEFIVYNDERDT